MTYAALRALFWVMVASFIVCAGALVARHLLRFQVELGRLHD